MLNKVILLGRLTKDPETRYTQSGTTVTRFTLAVDRTYVKQGEERKTDFIPVTTFAKTAEFVDKWFAKGDSMTVVGNLQTWSKDTDSGKKYGMDVIAEDVGFAGKKEKTDKPQVPQELQGSVNDDFLPVDDADLPF